MNLFRLFSFSVGFFTVLPAIIGGVWYAPVMLSRLIDRPVLALVSLIVLTLMTMSGLFHIAVSVDGLREEAGRSAVSEFLTVGFGLLITLAAGSTMLWEAIDTFHGFGLFWWWYAGVSASITLMGVTMMIAAYTDRKIFPK
jgi:uncharacterized membrane protein